VKVIRVISVHDRIGKKAKDLDERVGYYGEQLVLLAQTLGLETEQL